MNVAIYKLTKGFDVWVWCCTECLERRKAAGWDVLETRVAPHVLTCDDCEAP